MTLATVSRTEASFAPTSSLEALGILLIILAEHLGGSCVGCSGWEELPPWRPRRWEDGGRGVGVGEAWMEGGQREPGQRAATGPWRRSTPATVSEMARWQTAQDALEDGTLDSCIATEMALLYHLVNSSLFLCTRLIVEDTSLQVSYWHKLDRWTCFLTLYVLLWPYNITSV